MAEALDSLVCASVLRYAIWPDLKRLHRACQPAHDMQSHSNALSSLQCLRMAIPAQRQCPLQGRLRQTNKRLKIVAVGSI